MTGDAARHVSASKRAQYIRLRCVMIGRSDNNKKKMGKGEFKFKQWEKGNSSSSDSRCATTAAP